MNDEQKARELLAIDLAGEFYAILVKYVPPTTTLGELMVLTQIAKAVYLEEPMTVSEVSDATGLSRWSVSRALVPYIEDGVIAEQKDLRDSRKNRLVWTEEAFRGNQEWSKDWFALLEKAGKMIEELERSAP